MLVMACSFFIFGAIGLIVTYVLLQDKALEVQYHVMFVSCICSERNDLLIVVNIEIGTRTPLSSNIFIPGGCWNTNLFEF